MTVEKMKVTLDLSSITVEVTANKNNDKEILEAAKKAVLEQLAVKFPKFSYAIASADTLTMEEVAIGTTVNVEVNKKTEVGIISGKNQKTIDVALKGGRILQGHPSNFRLNTTANPDEIVWGQQIKGETTWIEGDTGFLNTGKETVAVILGKSKGKKNKAFIINGGGRHFPLEDKQLRHISATK